MFNDKFGINPTIGGYTLPEQNPTVQKSSLKHKPLPASPRKPPIQTPVTQNIELRIPTQPAGPPSQVKAAWPSRKIRNIKTLSVTPHSEYLCRFEEIEFL